MISLWEKFVTLWEDYRLLRLILQLVLVIGFIITGVKGYQILFKEDKEQKLTGQKEDTEEVYGKLSEETVHVLENPERYEEDDVDMAYRESLTTYDDEFVEKNVFEGDELKEGIYLYHEKVDKHYKEVARLAEDVSREGVPVYFYTPQNDQTIAAVSNLVNLLNEEGTEMVVKAVIKREGQELELIKDKQEVLEYLEGVVNANSKE